MQDLKEKYETRIRELQEQLAISSVYEVRENSNVTIGDAIPSNASAFRPVVADGAPAVPPASRLNSETELESLFDGHNQPLTIDTSSLSFEQLRLIPRGECEVSFIQIYGEIDSDFVALILIRCMQVNFILFCRVPKVLDLPLLHVLV